MSEKTNIAWCDHTFNAWWGCEEVTAECDNCYARVDANRRGFPNAWKGEYRTLSPEYWLQPLKWDRWAEAAEARKRVFTNSMADVFDMKAPASERYRLFSLIEQTPNLDWLVLTKRPGQAKTFLKRLWGSTPWPNVWLGVSAGQQQTVDAFLPIVLSTPARVHFLSYEPGLGAVDLRHVVQTPQCWVNALTGKWHLIGENATQRVEIRLDYPDLPPLDWVIVGGESGAKARPFRLSWAESVLAQCRQSKTAVFLKQLGTRPVDDDGRQLVLADYKGGDPEEWPARFRGAREFPS